MSGRHTDGASAVLVLSERKLQEILRAEILRLLVSEVPFEAEGLLPEIDVSLAAPAVEPDTVHIRARFSRLQLPLGPPSTWPVELVDVELNLAVRLRRQVDMAPHGVRLALCVPSMQKLLPDSVLSQLTALDGPFFGDMAGASDWVKGADNALRFMIFPEPAPARDEVFLALPGLGAPGTRIERLGVHDLDVLVLDGPTRALAVLISLHPSEPADRRRVLDARLEAQDLRFALAGDALLDMLRMRGLDESLHSGVLNRPLDLARPVYKMLRSGSDLVRGEITGLTARVAPGGLSLWVRYHVISLPRVQDAGAIALFLNVDVDLRQHIGLRLAGGSSAPAIAPEPTPPTVDVSVNLSGLGVVLFGALVFFSAGAGAPAAALALAGVGVLATSVAGVLSATDTFTGLLPEDRRGGLNLVPTAPIPLPADLMSRLGSVVPTRLAVDEDLVLLAESQAGAGLDSRVLRQGWNRRLYVGQAIDLDQGRVHGLGADGTWRESDALAVHSAGQLRSLGETALVRLRDGAFAALTLADLVSSRAQTEASVNLPTLAADVPRDAEGVRAGAALLAVRTPLGRWARVAAWVEAATGAVILRSTLYDPSWAELRILVSQPVDSPLVEGPPVERWRLSLDSPALTAPLRCTWRYEGVQVTGEGWRGRPDGSVVYFAVRGEQLDVLEVTVDAGLSPGLVEVTVIDARGLEQTASATLSSARLVLPVSDALRRAADRPFPIPGPMPDGG